MTPQEEREQAIKEYAALTEWANGLKAEQIDFLLDNCYYNDAIKGYLIAAGRNAGLDPDEIRELLNGLRLALSEMRKEDAESLYRDY